MRPHAVDPVQQRQLRKQDLLMASELARGQTLVAFNALAQRADAVAERVAQARQWLSRPEALAAGAAVVSLVFGVFLRRAHRQQEPSRWRSLLRWGWLAWRLWRSAGSQP